MERPIICVKGCISPFMQSRPLAKSQAGCCGPCSRFFFLLALLIRVILGMSPQFGSFLLFLLELSCCAWLNSCRPCKCLGYFSIVHASLPQQSARSLFSFFYWCSRGKRERKGEGVGCMHPHIDPAIKDKKEPKQATMERDSGVANNNFILRNKRASSFFFLGPLSLSYLI